MCVWAWTLIACTPFGVFTWWWLLLGRACVWSWFVAQVVFPALTLLRPPVYQAKGDSSDPNGVTVALRGSVMDTSTVSSEPSELLVHSTRHVSPCSVSLTTQHHPPPPPPPPPAPCLVLLGPLLVQGVSTRGHHRVDI